MKTVFAGALLGALVLTAASPAMAADAKNGHVLFRGQCGVCHAAGEGDGEGGAAPNLAGVVGRKVGGDPDFPAYTDALTSDKAVWTEAALTNFLQDPQKAIPGTAMPVRVGSATDRADIAAYLATLKKK